MSSEQIKSLESLHTPVIPAENKSRVDINTLLNRVRENQKKENKANLIFFGMVCLVILVVGIILSF